ncbi:TetR/AcrR family transcriptional regulator [Ornithinimicrobium cavernae]|uniref:TetR/AcrR family transcriptional regulator n=1 Tax=Ornithinimicrobium cavernae TaxID=2666047 RepID=UPI000D68A849|nr:TetR/AcrR family transcriptional regulator [Ornithinimicrobium cavernae]
MARTYELKRRAERQGENRQRIIDAAIELHQEVGPQATTVSDIAQRARVGRVTVYRHFPDEAALARACSGHYLGCHPAPDTEGWAAIADPEARLRTALAETYAFHRSTEAMMTKVLAGPDDHGVLADYHAHWSRAADLLAAPWGATGRRRAMLRAGIGLALAFGTWHSLVRGQGLTDEEAVEVAVRLAS